MEEKIRFYQDFIKQSFNNQEKMYTSLFKTSESALLLERRLLKIIETNKTAQVVKIVLFFYAQIKHDLYLANDLADKYKESLKVPSNIDIKQSLQYIHFLQDVAHL